MNERFARFRGFLVTRQDGRTLEICVNVEIEVTFEPMVFREVRPARSNQDDPPVPLVEGTTT